MNPVKRMVMELKARFGLTQGAIAKEAGIDPMTLSNWVTGRHTRPHGAKYDQFLDVYMRYSGDEVTDDDPPTRVGVGRDDAIVAMHRRGYPHPEIGAVFGISRERVRQIVAAHGEALRRR